MKKHKPSIEEWNCYVLMLGQALIGSISINIRMISLHFTSNAWIIETILETPCIVDEEEMEDVAEDCLIYIDDIRDEISSRSYKKIISKCQVSKEKIDIQNVDNVRIIFKRRE